MSDTALYLRGLHKAFRRGFLAQRVVQALDGLDLEVRLGEIYGFLGPNGAGKSTTLKIVMGLLRASAGEVRILGEPVGVAAWLGRVGYLPENPAFYGYLSARELLHHFVAIRGRSVREARRRADALLESIGLAHAADQKIRTFSKGMVQRLGFAQALLLDPDLLILDEPLSGLDPLGRRIVREHMLDAHRAGKTIFFSSHIIPDLESICTRVGVILRGKIAREGTMEDLLVAGIAGMQIFVEPKDDTDVRALLDHHPGVHLQEVPGMLRLRTPGEAEAMAVLKGLLERNVRVIRLEPIHPTLEEVLVDLMESK
jgi:ABC-2 type transport system ATP-binding protein